MFSLFLKFPKMEVIQRMDLCHSFMLSLYLTWIRYKSSTKSRTCHSVTYFSWLKSKQKVPAQAKTVILRFAHKSQATFLGHAKFASNNFSFKHRGQKNSLFTHKQQHVMHRSNSICPISAVWTVVCCVFDSAGVFWNYHCCSLYNKDYTNLYSSCARAIWMLRVYLS